MSMHEMDVTDIITPDRLAEANEAYGRVREGIFSAPTRSNAPSLP